MSRSLTGSSSTSRDSSKVASKSNNENTRSRKSRLVRRRARARLDGIDSDDELERVALSDDSQSDVDEDDLSPLDSQSDSDEELSDSESVRLSTGRIAHPDTPSSTQSPPPGEVEAAAAALSGFRQNGKSIKSSTPPPPPSSSSSSPPVVTKSGDDTTNATTTTASASVARPVFSNGPLDWSEMAEEQGGGESSTLPVIDFADLSAEHAEGASSSTPSHQDAQSSSQVKEHEDDTASTSKQSQEHASNKRGGASFRARGAAGPVNGANGSRQTAQSARQAYQNRLRSDPSFVPMVGEFWGHDDRLLQKDLRGLSGWWRGRWQGRGRGRGGFVGRGMRGRGGGFQGVPSVSHGSKSSEVGDATQESTTVTSSAPEIPPVERTWTHDGFEEMKAKEERRRALAEQQQKQQQATNSANNRGRPSPNGYVNNAQRGGFVPGRGRGAFAARRGAASPASSSPSRKPFTPPPHARTASTASASGAATGGAGSVPSGKIWYAMKPERAWTKQHEGFLHYEQTSKVKHGKKGGLRVNLPGKGSKDITRGDNATTNASARAPATSNDTKGISSEGSAPASQGPSSDAGSVSVNGRTVVVRLPKAAANEPGVPSAPEVAVETRVVTTSEEPIESTASSSSTTEAKVSTARHISPVVPPLPSMSIPIPVTATKDSSKLSEIAPSPTLSPNPLVTRIEAVATPGLTRGSSLSEKSSVDVPTITTTEEVPVVLPLQESKDEELERAHLGQLPPIQTVFPPPLQPSPTYSSPFAFPPQLPPGIALNQQGFAYEISSGRPVFLHATPPPLPLYNPRPLAHPHSVPFVPGHVHHASLGGEFYPPGGTPPLNGFIDPSTGTPLFSLPRQSSRIEIRAPSESESVKKSERRPSGLRSSTIAAQGDEISPSALRAGGQQPFTLSQLPSALAAPYVPQNDYFAEMSLNGMQMYPPLEGTPQPAGSPGADQQMLMPPGLVEQGMSAGYGYPQYYYPEQYAYPAYVDISQQPGAPYDAYAPDPRHQPPVFY